MDQTSQRQIYDDEITLRDLAREMWASRLMLACVIVVFAAGGIAIGLLADRQYRASTVLSPALEDASGRLGALGALASQYSGLASLAGIAVSGGSRKDEAIAVLQSELLTERYIWDNDLLPVLYADLWDPVSRKWRTNDPQKIPTLWKANRYFDKSIRGVLEDKKGLVVLSITWKDPKLAARWANDLVRITNSYLRDKAIQEAERNIIYLNEQASKTNVIEAQKAIYSLLQAEINKEMVARGREEYALKVIDPAFAPEKPWSAGPMLLGALGLGVGFMAAILIAFGRRVFLA